MHRTKGRIQNCNLPARRTEINPCVRGGVHTKAMRPCDIRSDAWGTPLALNGLLIRADRLPWHVPVQPFDGTVTLRMV